MRLRDKVGIAAGDAPPAHVTEAAYDRIMQVNLKDCLLSCQAVLPVDGGQSARIG